jgi:protein-disulfide isomerase
MAEARGTNWFAIWVSIAVVVALAAVAAVVLWMNNEAGTPDAVVTPDSAVIDTETGAISVGDGESTMDTYIDFMCPVCNQFEQVYGPAIAGLVEDGTITLNIHPIAILDRLSQGTQYSTRSANAMYCVAAADGTAAVPYMQALFENQPPEGSTGLTDEQLIELAATVEVTGIDACVTGGEYSAFVTTMTAQTPVAPGQSGIATPTIAVNGQAISNSTLPEPAELASLFD